MKHLILWNVWFTVSCQSIFIHGFQMSCRTLSSRHLFPVSSRPYETYPFGKRRLFHYHLNHNQDIHESTASNSLDEFISSELQIDRTKHWKIGLSDNQVKERIQRFGRNELPEPKQTTIFELFQQQFEDRLVQILLVVATISAISSFAEARDIVGEDGFQFKYFIEPIIIMLILIINATVGVWQQLSAISSIDALKKMQPRLATVLRINEQTGESQWIADFEASQLVPGDVVQMNVGEFVPADVCVAKLESSIFTTDESALTGETYSVSKIPFEQSELVEVNSKPTISEQTSMAFSGTIITAGRAVGIVLRTASATEMGKIQSSMNAVEDQKTPLTQKLDKFGDDLAKLIAMICVAVFFVSIPRFDDPSFPSVFDGAFYYAKVGVALGVAAIPEGLPAVITLVLALGTRRLAEKNVIVRNLPSVETLGSVSVICTDKTGTLTTNQMTAVSMVIAESESRSTIDLTEHIVEGSTYEPVGLVHGIDTEEIDMYPFGAVADVVSVSIGCNNARLIQEDKTYTMVGEPTEGALLTLAEKIGNIGKNHTGIDSEQFSWWQNYERYATLDFDRTRKSMSVLIRPFDFKQKSKHRLLVKGAPNLLLDRCTKVKLRNGDIVPLDDELRKEFEREIHQLSSRPLRCLLLAIKEVECLDESRVAYEDILGDPKSFVEIEDNLTVVGLIGIKDPARLDARDSIELCKHAGIRVIMMTGDSRDTAVAIAKELQILSNETNDENVKAFEGKYFFSRSETEQLDLLKEGNLVFCRVEPADKQAIVKLLQRLNEVPAMTGDGVNDAPALRQASIGIAMGSGTSVAKEAADMILVDDSFATIVVGVQEGRGIYMNMLSFIDFLISCNVGEVIAVFFATLLGYPSILSAMQLLWVNLITDGPPATALGFNPTENVMDKSPRSRDEDIITPWLLLRYTVIGTYIAFATVGIFTSHFLEMGVSFSEIKNWSQCSAESVDSFCDAFQTGKTLAMPQTLALTTLITSELLKALSSVSLETSITVIGPQRNPYLIIGVCAPMMIHLAILYSSSFGMPSLCDSFGLVPLSLENWITVIGWSFPTLLLDEMMKSISRNKEFATRLLQ